MGCKTSILECMRDKVELEKSTSSETRSSLVTSDVTETDKEQSSPYLVFGERRLVTEEDNYKVPQC
ncbi:hypothetical protein EAI_17439 [Harpegnathos saltator]|uniref:Uncharacterized protein n=2 Tax=Harpegnathos saltator TaxID=610380 RepID=E2C089_HARSA|nr:hypothetical protein EAI_17439 [Harpegnathos saltator]